MEILKTAQIASAAKKKLDDKLNPKDPLNGRKFDIYNRELALEDEILGAMKGQEEAEVAAVGETKKAEGTALQELRRSAAQALAGQRGTVEGGRGVALARGTAAVAGEKAAQISGDFAKQLSDARKSAALAKTERLAQEGKMLEAKKARSAEVADAQNQINSVVSTYQGKVYTSESDYKRMAADLDALAASATNPEVAKLYSEAAGKARAGIMPTSSFMGSTFGVM